MSQSMSLTKFTTHLDERHSWRRSWWVHIISARQTFREHFVSVGVLSSTQGMWHNKGREWSAPAQPDEILSVPPLSCFPPFLALAECLQCVPDQSPRASWAEGREGYPWSAGSRGPGGRKGTSDSGNSEQTLWSCLSGQATACYVWICVLTACVLTSMFAVYSRGIRESGVLWVTLGKKAQR